jgi:hypothetical protein
MMPCRRQGLAPAAKLAVPAEPSFEEKKAIVLANPTLTDVLARLMKAHPDAGAGDLIEEIYAFMWVPPRAACALNWRRR